MYEIRTTRTYRKAFKRVSQHKDFDLAELERVIDTLARGKKLDARYKDHQLTGELAEYRECHVQNDVLLVYCQQDELLVLVLVDLGSHSELF